MNSAATFKTDLRGEGKESRQDEPEVAVRVNRELVRTAARVVKRNERWTLKKGWAWCLARGENRGCGCEVPGLDKQRITDGIDGKN